MPIKLPPSALSQSWTKEFGANRSSFTSKKLQVKKAIINWNKQVAKNEARAVSISQATGKPLSSVRQALSKGKPTPTAINDIERAKIFKDMRKVDEGVHMGIGDVSAKHANELKGMNPYGSGDHHLLGLKERRKSGRGVVVEWNKFNRERQQEIDRQKMAARAGAVKSRQEVRVEEAEKRMHTSSASGQKKNASVSTASKSSEATRIGLEAWKKSKGSVSQVINEKNRAARDAGKTGSAVDDQTDLPLAA